MNEINIVAPIYNEELNIKEFTKRVITSVEKVTFDYKIIFIDDGSSDGSWAEIKKICASNNKTVGIKLSKNFGHHNAITAGIHNSDSSWVVVMDTDLQDRPEVIPDLYLKAQEGHDVVFVRRVERPESLVYKILQKLFYMILITFSGINFDSKQANFSIISKKVVEAFKQFNEQSRFYASTVNWLGFNKTTIDAEHGKRYKGKPSYTFRSRIKLATDIMFSFSDKALKASMLIGFIIGVVNTLFFVVVTFLGKNFSYDLLLRINLFLNSLLLIFISTHGLYLLRIFNEGKNRPLFIIDKTINL